jgi:hypothetical protein
MTSTAMLTELEAVNIILQAADEAPVGALELSGLYPLDKAKGILSEASRVIQSMGWKFNTEYGYPVTRDGSGQINLPPNMIRLDVDDTFLSSVDPVQRGLRLYDAKNHTYTFTQDLTGTVVFLLEWDELPQPARQYIAIRAARTMQGRSSIPETTYRYSADDETAALLALSEHETQVGDHNMLRDSWSVASVLFNREML